MVLSEHHQGPYRSSPYANTPNILRPDPSMNTAKNTARPARTNFHNIMDLIESSSPQTDYNSVFVDVIGKDSTLPACVKMEPQVADVRVQSKSARRILATEYEHVTRDSCFLTPSSSVTSPQTTGSSPSIGSTSFSSISSLGSSPCRSPGSDPGNELSHGRRPSVDLSDCSPEVATSGSGKPESSDCSKTKKGRTIYKAQQVFILEQVFHRTQYPDPEVIETLARDLNISEAKIKVWFQNKRARWRRRDPSAAGPAPASPFSASILQSASLPANPAWNSPMMPLPSMMYSTPAMYGNQYTVSQNARFPAAVPSIASMGQFPSAGLPVTSQGPYVSPHLLLAPSRPSLQL